MGTIWLNSDRLSAWVPPSTKPIDADSRKNAVTSPAATVRPVAITAVHSTRLPRIVRFAPIRSAMAPSPNAPNTATNCTSRIADVSVVRSISSSSVAKIPAAVMTVATPSL